MTKSDSTRTEAPAALLTVAICTRNRVGFLAKAVASLLDQCGCSVPVLIIDNASTDATPAMARDLAAKHDFIQVYRENELGLSAARNAALATASSEFVIFLDDDATAGPGWIDAYAKFLNGCAANVAAAGGPVKPVFEKPCPAWCDTKSLTLELGSTPFRFESGGPWGGNLALRRATALKVGGFNPKLGRKGNQLGAHEETELFDRLRTDGQEIWWLPDPGIDHFIGAEKLRLCWQLRCEFTQGRSTAVTRLAKRPGAWERGAYATARLFAAPWHLL
ncbi:MAG: glycosyltransferase, partial [Verrucomicrobiota bacterium]